MNEYFHTRHACGHAVFWSDVTIAASLAPYPCPYCGGEAGKPTPPEANTLDCGEGLYCFRYMNDDGTVPGPGSIGEQVVLRHRVDGLCCDQ